MKINTQLNDKDAIRNIVELAIFFNDIGEDELIVSYHDLQIKCTIEVIADEET